MATFPVSSIIRSNALNGRATDSSYLVFAGGMTSQRIVAQRLGKKDGRRNLVFGGVAMSAGNRSYHEHRQNVLITSQSFVLHTPEKVWKYLFRTESGDLVKVWIEMKNNNYSVYVEVSSPQLSESNSDLLMVWGMYRSDSSSFMPMDHQSSSLISAQNTTETPLLLKSSGKIAVELNLEANLAPFYLSFTLKSRSSDGSRISEIRSHRNTNFCVPVGFSSGYPAPLGLSFSPDGSMNFSLFSRSAERVVLCLYDETIDAEPALEIDLDPYVNRTGDIWHASLHSAVPLVSYGYRCHSGTKREGDSVLLDPYAKIVGNSSSTLLRQYLGKFQTEPDFDWTGDIRPLLPLEKLVVYRLNVMRFTKDQSSKLANDIVGTFAGISQKLQHFKDLGINTILLEPIFPFNDQQGPYFPYHLFSPAYIYGHSKSPISTIVSMKEMVKTLHANGIEVFMEVVYTHMADTESLKDIDNPSYHYAREYDGIHKNTLNCNFPVVQQLILDSLRHWVIEFHIDGFCFMNAASLLRGCNGETLFRPPLVEAIAFDPILSNVKIIADCWNPHDAEPKAVRFPHWKRWAEVNTKFCEDVRKYLRGENLLSNLATRLCGSGDNFSAGRGPAFSFNFIARNSGLSLVDLVSFSASELASELSWNCGVEGATTNSAILETRLKQVRNFLFILFVSLGVPVLNMGDECGQSSGGSPAYADRKPFNWDSLKTVFGIQTTEFISFLSSLRVRRSDLLQKKNFLKEENIEWCGIDLNPPNWEDPETKFLGMTLKVYTEEIQPTSSAPCLNGNMFIAFNAADHSESILLPPPPTDMEWRRLVDTALSYPEFFSTDGDPVFEQMLELLYEMKSHSCVLFESRPKSG
ncbi:Isoamylase 2, chloroplastic [Heracleum sosnowskyi]|uniref:Isoamylase 2, chloroplastic n=1 Tax=Heracleum sosnowskyi TaxID=360622 RepID=A0AAD8GQB3_9APIA|nr:Isoamylase 2, chloroplastic [Heracleum sosnowskyi]